MQVVEIIEEKPEEEPEITHRVFLDIDIDKQRLGCQAVFLEILLIAIV